MKVPPLAMRIVHTAHATLMLTAYAWLMASLMLICGTDSANLVLVASAQSIINLYWWPLLVVCAMAPHHHALKALWLFLLPSRHPTLDLVVLFAWLAQGIGFYVTELWKWTEEALAPAFAAFVLVEGGCFAVVLLL